MSDDCRFAVPQPTKRLLFLPLNRFKDEVFKMRCSGPGEAPKPLYALLLPW